MSEPLHRRLGAPLVPLALALALAAAAGAYWLLRGAASPPDRIVLVVIDTLRRDHVSAYGGPPLTPNLDALARRGQRFDAALASFHQTSMSMGALFTGRTPSLELGVLDPSLPWNGTTWCGLARFAPRGGESCIPEGLPTLAEELRDGGYWTIGIASNQFLYEPSGFARGFDDWVEVGERPEGTGPLAMLTMERGRSGASRAWPRVQAAAEAALERRPRDRFFLYVHYMDVHDYSLGSREPPARAYRRAVATADVAVGRLLRHLEQRGLLDGALVVVTSDHGERLAERHALEGRPQHLGNPSFQEVLAVPLLAAPGLPRPASRLLRSEDLFAALLESAGLEPPPAPEPLAPDELLLGEKRYRTYLSGRWKSVVRREDAGLHLFDLERDPGERRDVAQSHPEVVRAHRTRVEELSAQLAAEAAERVDLSPLDRARLKILGYLEE